MPKESIKFNLDNCGPNQSTEDYFKKSPEPISEAILKQIIMEAPIQFPQPEIKEDKGLRLNKGKVRYDLFEPFAMEQLAKVFTKGAEKYAENNWLGGMKWSKMQASLMRHLEAFKKGEDYDYDPTCKDCVEGNCTNHTGLLHMAQVAWNALALVSYYKHYPQGDDRYIMPSYRWGFDIDEVICDWVGPWCQKFGKKMPTSWYFEWDTLDKFEEMNRSGELSLFYASLPPKINPVDIPVEPVCYISHRPVEVTTTKNWLESHGFPLKPVIHVTDRREKVQVAKDQKLDFFVDDNYDTYRAMNDAGICCYLLDAGHNQRFRVPAHKRIKSLKELPV